jgi:hypothetical protein
MGIGEAVAVGGDKPQVHANKSPPAGSAEKFNEARQAAAGTAARASGGKPMIVRIDANYRSKSATATLSDGSKVPLALTKNQLEPGDTLHTLEYGPETGPEDSPVVELSCASGASCSILWTQPADYALSPKVIVSIKQDPEEGARRRLAQLPQYIQDYVTQQGGDLESRAKMGEDLVKSGAKKEDFAPVEIQGKAPADPDFKFVEAARKGRYSQFPSFDEFKKDLEAQVAYAKQQARTNGLNPPDPFEGAEWKDDPAAAKEKWDKYVFTQYDKAVKNEAAGLRHVGEVASMAQNAIFEALGLSAALGTGGAFLAAGGEALALPTLLEGSTGVSTTTWLGTFAKYGLGISFGMNLINRGKEGIDAGSDPVSIGVAAATDTFGGKVVEKITNKSNLTGKDLNLTAGDRVIGGITDLAEGVMNTMGVREFAKVPGVGEPPVLRWNPAEPTGSAGNPGASPSAELHVPGPHPFFKKPPANSNELLAPAGEAAAQDLAATGTGDIAPAKTVDTPGAQGVSPPAQNIDPARISMTGGGGPGAGNPGGGGPKPSNTIVASPPPPPEPFTGRNPAMGDKAKPPVGDASVGNDLKPATDEKVIVDLNAIGESTSDINRHMIERWLAARTLEPDEMKMLMRMLRDEHPVLNDLIAARNTAAGPALRAQLNGIMARFAEEAGVSITVVPDGAVQAVRGAGDVGSMRSRPGYYEIEQSVYNDDVRLRKELIHQITAYLGSRNGLGPVAGNRNSAQWLAYFVREGGF